MLEGEARQFYLAHRCSFETMSLESVCDTFKAYFEDSDYRMSARSDWDHISLQAIIDANKEKSLSECFDMMISKMRMLLYSLCPENQIDLYIRLKLVMACRDIPACQSACMTSMVSVGVLVGLLRRALAIQDRRNAPKPSSESMSLDHKSDDKDSKNKSMSTDNKSHETNSNNKSVSRDHKSDGKDSKKWSSTSQGPSNLFPIEDFHYDVDVLKPSSQGLSTDHKSHEKDSKNKSTWTVHKPDHKDSTNKGVWTVHKPNDKDNKNKFSTSQRPSNHFTVEDFHYDVEFV